MAPAPPAPIGVSEQVLEAVSHAYDSEEAVLQGIDQMGDLPVQDGEVAGIALGKEAARIRS